MTGSFGTRALGGFLLATALVIGAVVVAAPGGSQTSPAAVDLGTAEPFVILAGTPDITNVPPSVITGDVGLSPASAATSSVNCTDLTGTSQFFTVDAAGPGPPCQVEDPATLTSAKSALTAAYLDAAGRAGALVVGSELGGNTFTAGVYTSASTAFGITAGAGPVTIDAQGDPNAVFIFQAPLDATGLTVGPGSEVVLAGGAQACNIWWTVNSASIDTTAIFKGNILALTSITVNQGADIEGRLLAQNGTVTLIQDTITAPLCQIVPPTTPTTLPPGPPGPPGPPVTIFGPPTFAG